MEGTVEADCFVKANDTKVERFVSHGYHDWKGNVTQDCLFASPFLMLVTFALTGWEGSVMDAWVFKDAQNYGFNLPASEFQLNLWSTNCFTDRRLITAEGVCKQSLIFTCNAFPAQ